MGQFLIDYRSYESQNYHIKLSSFFNKQQSCQYCCMDVPHRHWLSIWRESLTAIPQESCELYWTSPGGSSPQSSSCTDTYHPCQKTIQIRQARHVGHSWRSKGELISDVLLWTPSHGWARIGWPARTYVQQLCTDTGCSMEDLLWEMDDRGERQKRVWEIRASGTLWW